MALTDILLYRVFLQPSARLIPLPPCLDVEGALHLRSGQYDSESILRPIDHPLGYSRCPRRDMSQIRIFLRCVFAFATIVAFAQCVFAAVIILDGTATPPSQARPPAGSTPGGVTQEEAPSPAQSAPSAPTENATANPEAAPQPGPTAVV